MYIMKSLIKSRTLISLPVKNDKLFRNIRADEYVFVVVIVQLMKSLIRNYIWFSVTQVTWVGCTKDRWRYPPDSDFFSIVLAAQKAIKSNYTMHGY